MNKKLLFGGIIALSLAVLAFVGWHFKTMNDEGCQLNIPEDLGGLSRTEFITGPEAISQISKMHSKDIKLTDGHIAKYAGGEAEVTLWISVSPNNEEGKDIFRLMDEKMPQSKVFLNRQDVDVDGRALIKVDGMGLEHFYWVNGKYNYWIAIKGTESKPILQDVLKKVI